MLNIGRFSSWITINGAETPEYNIQVADDGKSVTCWIASEAGKTFGVHWSDNSPSDDTCGDVRVDGKKVGGRFVPADFSLRHKEISVLDIPTSSTTARPLLFSVTELTDDDTYLTQAISPELGTIVLEVSSALMGDSTFGGIHDHDALGGKVHERSKKLAAHSVKLGAEKYSTNTRRFVDTTRLDLLASFTFKYRPIDILKAQGIIVAATSPKRKAAEVPEDETKPDVLEIEDDNIDAEVQALQARIEALKEKKASKAGKNKRVKREHKPIQMGEVIDLT